MNEVTEVEIRMFFRRFGCRWGKAQQAQGLAEEEPWLVWRGQQVVVPVTQQSDSTWNNLKL
jgi:hypothetical protein